MCLAACSGSRAAPPPTTTAAPPATSSDGVPSLIAGPPARYARIEVLAGSKRVTVPPALAPGVAPLLIARDFGAPAPLADYGLDHPSATIVFATDGAPIDIAIGGANFDRTGLYAQRAGLPDVYLVLAGPVRPVLALVGVQLAPAA